MVPVQRCISHLGAQVRGACLSDHVINSYMSSPWVFGHGNSSVMSCVSGCFRSCACSSRRRNGSQKDRNYVADAGFPNKHFPSQYKQTSDGSFGIPAGAQVPTTLPRPLRRPHRLRPPGRAAPGTGRELQFGSPGKALSGGSSRCFSKMAEKGD